jgi:hypothetical protein
MPGVPLSKSELVYAQTGGLYRFVEGEKEPVQITKDYGFFVKGMNARIVRGGDVLLVWGRRGLAWVNLETARLERLFSDAVRHDGVDMLGADHVVVTTDDGGLYVWSIPKGRRLQLAESAWNVDVAANGSRVAWGTTGGANLLSEAEVRALFAGDAVSPKSVLAPSRARTAAPTP